MTNTPGCWIGAFAHGSESVLHINKINARFKLLTIPLLLTHDPCVVNYVGCSLSLSLSHSFRSSHLRVNRGAPKRFFGSGFLPVSHIRMVAADRFGFLFQILCNKTKPWSQILNNPWTGEWLVLEDKDHSSMANVRSSVSRFRVAIADSKTPCPQSLWPWHWVFANPWVSPTCANLAYSVRPHRTPEILCPGNSCAPQWYPETLSSHPWMLSARQAKKKQRLQRSQGFSGVSAFTSIYL